MTPIIVLGVGLAVMAPMTPSTGTFGHQTGTMRPAPTYTPTYTPPPAVRYTPPAYTTPSTRSTAPLGAERFTPYRPQSVYSNRGGANAYPSAPKPPGYINPYGNPYGK